MFCLHAANLEMFLKKSSCRNIHCQSINGSYLYQKSSGEFACEKEKKNENPQLAKIFGIRLLENEFWQENRGITEP